MKKPIIILVIIAAVVGLGIWLAGKSGTSDQPLADAGKLVRSDSHQTNAGAKVTLVEFGDFQCPACEQAYPVVKQITDQYAGNKDFNFVFRNFPLPQHQYAQIAAEAAEAAGAQGKFFQMYDQLYQHQNDWVASDTSDKALQFFAGYAQGMGLDVNKFKQDVQGNKYQANISADQQDGNALNVDATPTFYVNGKQFVGIPTQELKDEITKDLSAK